MNVFAAPRNAPGVEQLFLWQPAISENALTDDATRDVGALAHEHFPAAHRAVKRIVALHTRFDGVLGGRPEHQPPDPEPGWVEALGEELEGYYPWKYLTGDDLAAAYLPDYHPKARDRQGLYPGERTALRRGHLPALAKALREEARDTRIPTAAPDGPLPALSLLRPWAREARLSEADLMLITERLTALLAEREDLPLAVAPAMGWGGPNADDPLIRDLEDRGKLEVIDQKDLLTSHSGMKFPDERLFQEIYVARVMDAILRHTGFGSY